MVNAIPQNYNYGNYEFGKGNPFGKVAGLGPRIQGIPTIDNEYGISIPANFALVDDGQGNKISMGQDGLGLAHRNAEEFRFHAIG